MFDFNSDSLKVGDYVFLGYQNGSFQDRETGANVAYRNIFVMKAAEQSNNRSVVGYVSEKLKITDTSLCAGFTPGELVRLYFDQYGRVNTVLKVNAK